MRHTWPLFLLAIVLVIGGVGATYYARLKQQFANAPAKPRTLPPGMLGNYHGWTYTHTSSQNTVVKISADDVKELDGKEELTNLVLDIYHKGGDAYDHVKSERAEFDIQSGMLYSDGKVDIILDVKPDEPPSGKLMSITSSGVHVESKTGKATTDRLATFHFDRGEGQCVGADYDPDTRELKMRSEVHLTWRGTDPNTIPMKIETGDLYYKERDQKVYLEPWSKLTRDTLTLEAGPAEVTLASGGVLQHVETTNAHGTDLRPARNLEYAAKQLTVDFNDSNQIQKITGTEDAHVVSTAETTATTLTADKVVMEFDTQGDDSLLQKADATGHGYMESKPVIKPGADPSDTRILKSDVIHAKMRPGGQELEAVETDTPAAIEFIPNKPENPHRWMNGDRISILYAEKNQIQTVRSHAVTTRTEKPKLPDQKGAPAPELTWSNELVATFQPNSSQLATLDQWNNFRYQEGDRRAKADHAALDQQKNKINLTGAARVWDATGSADADKILLDQATGDMTAEGNVRSTRLPDKNKNTDPNQGGGMLSEDEPLNARAAKMQTTDNNLQVRYEGHAVLWQGANRLEADAVEIDRDNHHMNADGHVVSQLLDKKKDGDSKTADAKSGTSKTSAAASDSSAKNTNAAKTSAARPATQSAAGQTTTNQATRVFTTVRAPKLDYDDEKRIARYSDGVELERMNMKVKAKVIRAFLRNDSHDSSLDHAFAEGSVEVLENASDRQRHGTSDHAEYYPDDAKVILEGGAPQFIDSVKGTTQGEKLTWFSDEDRLIVAGAPGKSLLHRKKLTQTLPTQTTQPARTSQAK
jgi:lipopolysaccharide export system protein LptA